VRWLKQAGMPLAMVKPARHANLPRSQVMVRARSAGLVVKACLAR
jgi:hypothetical protein